MKKILTVKKNLFFLAIVLVTFCFVSCEPEVEIKTVTFDSNGATGDAPLSIEVEKGGNITIPSANSLSKKGYSFTGWNTQKDGKGTSYEVLQSVKIDSDITLYAQWRNLPTYTITFDYNVSSDGSCQMYLTMFEGETLIVPSCELTSKDEYVFDCWNTVLDESGNYYLADTSITVNGNMTLYAIWKPRCLEYTYSSGTDSYSVKCNDKTIPAVDIPSRYHGRAITSIGNVAFGYCKKLTTVTIPSSVTSIGSSAFISCEELTEITIPEGVKRIEKDTFNACKKMTMIKIPNSVTFIGDAALGYCYKLTTISYDGTKTDWEAIDKKNTWNSNTGNYTITCTDGSITKDTV